MTERASLLIFEDKLMDWYPLWNSLRIALISCAAVFFLGIFAAYYIAKLPRAWSKVCSMCF